MRRALLRLWPRRHALRLDGIVFARWQDLPGSGSPFASTGVLDAGGSPKPALDALREATGTLGESP
jgi:hypothetical protein